MRQQQTISLLDCDVRKVDFIWQLAMTNSAQWLGWEEAPKHFPKPNLHQKKDMALVWWSAACLIHYSFLNPGETITFEKYAQQIKEMQPHMKPALINRKGPILLHDKPNWMLYNQHFESWTNWATKFSLIDHIHLTPHQLTTTSSSISTTFCRENASTTSRRQKMLLKSSWGMDFYTTRMSKLISCWQKCVDCNCSYFD